MAEHLGNLFFMVERNFLFPDKTLSVPSRISLAGFVSFNFEDQFPL